MNARGLARAAGVDRAVLLLLLARFWSLASGVITVVMVSRFLTPQVQGYYFAMGSLVALQVLAELGLGQALLHFASHELANLSWTQQGTLTGDAGAKRRLRELLAFALRWFGWGGILMVVVLVPGGLHFLLRAGDMPPAMRLAWMCVVPLTAASLVVSAVFSVVEGCGRVGDVSLARLAQGVVSTLALWLALAWHAGVLALAAQAGAVLLTGLVWLAVFYRHFLRDLFSHRHAGSGGLDWRSELWPFQWRIAVSWASGYLIAQLFTPLLFATHGPVAAGQMGLTLQVFGALNMVALAWIASQVPKYGQMIARGEGRSLDRLFRRNLLQSSAALLALLALFLACVWALGQAGSPIVGRIAPLRLLAVLSVVALANHVTFAEAALLRAHKQDPFMALSIANGVVTAALCFAWIPGNGLQGATAAYAVAALLVGLGAGSVVFLRKRRQWWMASSAEFAGAKRVRT